jgi:hypothetical protein
MGKNNSSKSYLGNPNLKGPGVKIEFTKEQVEEYVKCANDPVYFTKNYIKIVTLDKGLVPFELYDYQEDIIDKIHNNRYVIAKLPRQSGKSTTVIAYILHYILFNQNMSVAILANKQSTAREMLSRLKLAYEYLPKWLQQGILEWNKGSIQLENGSKILASSTSASAVRGGSFNLLFLDEFAFVPQNIAEEFFSSVFPTITSGLSTKVLLISTPNGLNMFYKLWKGATKKPGEPGKNEYVPIEVHWSQVPSTAGGKLRDQKWKEEMIKQTSEKQFESEFECNFLGSSNTLISTSKLNALTWNEPIYKSKDGLVVFEEPKEDHLYFISVDTARGQGKDYSAFTVIDATSSPYKVVCRYRNNLISPMLYPTIIEKTGHRYNKAYVFIEINDIGGQVADILHSELEYEHVLMSSMKGRKGQVVTGGFGRGESVFGVRTTSQVKRLGCSILKNLIEQDKLILEDFEILTELMSFVSKAQTFGAEDGHTDDLVMTLVLFAWLTRQPYFKELTNLDTRIALFKNEIKQLEEDLAPFGFISTYDEDNLKTFSDGTDVWSVEPKNEWK